MYLEKKAAVLSENYKSYTIKRTIKKGKYWEKPKNLIIIKLIIKQIYIIN